MILDRQSFDYHNKALIEKVTFGSPYKHEGVFQNAGCFLYIKEEGAKIFSSDINYKPKTKEAVLLKCGTYFIDLVKKKKEEKFEVIAFHLFPDILKDLFAKELPALIAKNTHRPTTQVVVPKNIITKFIESLDFYFKNPSLMNDDLLELKIKELILLLIQTKNIESIMDLMSDFYSSKTINLKHVIELHIFSNLSINELAKLCNLSVSSFKRKFKEEFNDSPINYFITSKLKRAKDLLMISTMSINEIAYEIGFNDPLYFTRQFKKRIGSSPSDYRKEHLYN